MSAPRSAHFAAIAFLVFAVTARPAAAVDSWLVTESDAVDPDKPVWIALVTGEVFPIADGVVDPARVDRLVDQYETQRIPIEGLRAEDDAMAARYPFDRSGIHVLGLTLLPRLIELDGDVFDQYLIEERANDALAARKDVAARQAPVRERYTKYAKTIVEVGAVKDDDRDYLKPIGHRLEIIPMTNPTRWQTGEVVELQVLLDGHPWPEVPVTAAHAGETSNDAALRTRTNERGIAAVRLTQSGHWYAKAHLIRPYEGLGDIDWESFWTTYTFRVKGRVDVSGSLQMLRAIHGRVDPWAVAGFLMGERALIELRLPYGSDDFLAVQHGPAALPYSAMLDGIQAATGATAGKLNLKLKPASAEELRCEFLRLSTGEGVVYRLRDEMLQRLHGTDEESADSLAVRMMAMPLDEIFDGTVNRSGPLPAPSPEDAQTRGWDNARLREAQLKPLVRLAGARRRDGIPDFAPAFATGAPRDSTVGDVALAAEEITPDAENAGPSTQGNPDEGGNKPPRGVESHSRRPARRMGLAESLWRVDKNMSAGEKSKKGPPSPDRNRDPGVRVTVR